MVKFHCVGDYEFIVFDADDEETVTRHFDFFVEAVSEDAADEAAHETAINWFMALDSGLMLFDGDWLDGMTMTPVGEAFFLERLGMPTLFDLTEVG